MTYFLPKLTKLGFIIVSVIFIQIVQAADGCYIKNSNSGIQVALAQYPCSSNRGVQVCCNIGDTCGEDSICRINTAFTLPAVLTSTSIIKPSSATPTTTLATISASTLVSLSRVTSQPSSSTVPRPTSSAIYPISSVAELLSSLSLPSGINLVPRQYAYNGSFYIGGCTDISYNSSECSNHCTGYSLQNIVYNSSTSSWHCCGDTLADCSAPSRETFNAIPPSAFDTIAPVPPPVASTLASSVISSAYSTSTDDSPLPRSSGFSPGASAGIAFGVTLPILFTIAASLGFCLRKRKLRARRRALIDRALSEELASRMTGINSWYEGQIIRPGRPILRLSTSPSTNGSGGVDAPGHTFAYETPEGLRQVNLEEQTTTSKRTPLQLQFARLHFGLGPRRGRNSLNRNQSCMLVSPQDMAVSPIRRGHSLGLTPASMTEQMESSTNGTGTWPIAPMIHRPWELQRSLVSLREMDGTGVNPLEQSQSDESGNETDANYDDIVNTISSIDGEWQIQGPWQIQKPPSVRDMDGTGRLSLPAW